MPFLVASLKFLGGVLLDVHALTHHSKHGKHRSIALGLQSCLYDLDAGPLTGIVRYVSRDVELHAVGVVKLFKHLDKFAPPLITSRKHGCETQVPKQSLNAYMCACMRTCYKNAYFYAAGIAERVPFQLWRWRKA